MTSDPASADRAVKRAKEALELLVKKRLPDGRWPMESSFLRSPGFNFVKDTSDGEWKEVKGKGFADVPAIYPSLGMAGRETRGQP